MTERSDLQPVLLVLLLKEEEIPVCRNQDRCSPEFLGKAGFPAMCEPSVPGKISTPEYAVEGKYTHLLVSEIILFYLRFFFKLDYDSFTSL